MGTGTAGTFEYDGFRLAYSEFGEGARPFVLLPGLLGPRSLNAPLAEALARRGNYVITFDPLGHGESDQPTDMWHYSMQLFAYQVVALLDHLEIGEAIVGGPSLASNITLETSVLAPERLRGMVVEMPVLDNALLACALAFTPLLVAYTLGEPVTRPLTAGLRRLPRLRLWHYMDVMHDWISRDPRPSAAILQGLFFGRIAPPRSERRHIETPALVIGHGRDPIHPFSDADCLVRELPNGRFLEANSVFELRLAPDRITNEIARFADECWRPASAAPRTRRPRSTRPRRASA